MMPQTAIAYSDSPDKLIKVAQLLSKITPPLSNLSTTSMVGIRKTSQPARHDDFRHRLERALSLSPSDSDSTQGSQSSAEGDTTEIESLGENGFPNLQRETDLIGSIPQDASEDWIQRTNVEEKLSIGGESVTPDNRIMIAFQCISE